MTFTISELIFVFVTVSLQILRTQFGVLQWKWVPVFETVSSALLYFLRKNPPIIHILR